MIVGVMLASSQCAAGVVNDDYRQLETAAYCIGVLKSANSDPIPDGPYKDVLENARKTNEALIRRNGLFVLGSPIKIGAKITEDLMKQGASDGAMCAQVRSNCADKTLLSPTAPPPASADDAMKSLDDCTSVAKPVCDNVDNCFKGTMQ
jgi:hypothetical protein